MSKSKEPETLGELREQVFKEYEDQVQKELSPKANLIEEVAYYTKESLNNAANIYNYLSVYSPFKWEWGTPRGVFFIQYCLRLGWSLERLTNIILPDIHLPLNSFIKVLKIHPEGCIKIHPEGLHTHHEMMIWNHLKKYYKAFLNPHINSKKDLSYGEHFLDVWPKPGYTFLDNYYTSAREAAFCFTSGMYAGGMAWVLDWLSQSTEYSRLSISVLNPNNILENKVIVISKGIQEQILEDIRPDAFEDCQDKHFYKELLIKLDIEHAQAQEILLARQAATPGEAGLGESNGTGKISKEEANIRAREILRTNPKITARELAEQIHCSLGLVPNLTSWKAVQAKLKEGRKPKAPKVVSLTEPLESILGDYGPELQRAIDEQTQVMKADEGKHFRQRKNL